MTHTTIQKLAQKLSTGECTKDDMVEMYQLLTSISYQTNYPDNATKQDLQARLIFINDLLNYKII